MLRPGTNFLMIAAFSCISIGSLPQPPKIELYKNKAFAEIKVEKNIQYNNNIPEGIKKKRYQLDLYMPATTTTELRPVILWMHGGGFKYGSKNAKGIPIWSKAFAERGYVCAAINYRLSKKRPLKRFHDLAEGRYEGVIDIEQAVRFLKRNYLQYGIDTNAIILAGHSAGAMIAIHSVYSSRAELAKKFNSSSDSFVHNPLNIAAIINFWGAIFDTKWMANSKVPIVSVHGKTDRIVPYTHAGSPIYGSYLIHASADSLHIPNRLRTYDKYGHELQRWFNPIIAGRGTKKRWREAGEFAAAFLSEVLFAPAVASLRTDRQRR